MLYKNADNTLTPVNIRQEFPGTSFPKDLSQYKWEPPYFRVLPTSQPTTSIYERAVQTDPFQGEDGKWYQAWSTQYLPSEDILAAKIADIRLERKRVEALPVILDGIPYDMDATARAKYVETALTFAAFPDLEIPGWKASDDQFSGLGNYVTMTKTVLDNVWYLALEQNKKAFAWESAMHAELDAAISAVNISALCSVSTKFGDTEQEG